MKEKIGILYYSLSGHTKKIAEEIKNFLDRYGLP